MSDIAKPQAAPVDAHRATALIVRLMVVIVAMFAFGYALIPMYRAICRITGINNATPLDPDAAAFAKSTQVDATRNIDIQFDANARGPWQFKPHTGQMSVHPGEVMSITYSVTNGQDRTMQAQAIPSFAPGEAMQYFRKVECFCFQQQTLKAHETREFPVVFVVDPKLPRDVKTITLSYTFFEVSGTGASVVPAAPAS
jgi:cytochrome c oxidase assembly protein subunit 11